MLKGLVSKKNLLLGLGIFFIFIMFINLFCTCEGFGVQVGGSPQMNNSSGQMGGSSMGGSPQMNNSSGQMGGSSMGGSPQMNNSSGQMGRSSMSGSPQMGSRLSQNASSMSSTVSTNASLVAQ
jgi:hypothetical protein